MRGETRSVYVHAPYCRRRCFYCDFAVTVESEPGHQGWLDAISTEWRLVREEGRFEFLRPLETLYVGGGTPSLLGGAAMEGLAQLFGPTLTSSPDLEWTAEANPESFTEALAAEWRTAGVNRISLGVQSFHEPSLRWMGRLHGPDGAATAVRTATDAGFDNLSVDLIFGLPSRLGRVWSEDLRRAVDLDVPHLSLYGLTVESRTPLGRAVAERREEVAAEDEYRREYLEAVERLTDAGYIHYEVSSFSRPGMESRHNRVYWSGRPYLGLGNGAHGFIAPFRRWNLRDWAEYCTTVAQGRLPVEGQEELDEDARRLEAAWLGLRTREGVPMREFPAVGQRLSDRWIRSGWAIVVGDRLRLTAHGWLLLDALAVEMDGDLSAHAGVE